MATVQIRDIDDTVKKTADIAFKNMGISTSAGIKMFIYHVAQTGKIHFKPQAFTENGFTPEQEQKILTAWKDSDNEEIGPFNTMEEFFEDLEKNS